MKPPQVSRCHSKKNPPHWGVFYDIIYFDDTAWREKLKIAIIGLGSVGSAVATAVKNTGLAHEIVLFDRDGVRARAAAEDLGHAAAFSYDVKITAVNNYRSVRGCEIVIIAAGANQKPGQTPSYGIA